MKLNFGTRFGRNILFWIIHPHQWLEAKESFALSGPKAKAMPLSVIS
jgi:hypothetical protein